MGAQLVVFLSEQLNQQQIYGFSPNAFVADEFVAILRETNKNVAIDARVSLSSTDMSQNTPIRAENNKLEPRLEDQFLRVKGRGSNSVHTKLKP